MAGRQGEGTVKQPGSRKKAGVGGHPLYTHTFPPFLAPPLGRRDRRQTETGTEEEEEKEAGQEKRHALFSSPSSLFRQEDSGTGTGRTWTGRQARQGQ